MHEAVVVAEDHLAGLELEVQDGVLLLQGRVEEVKRFRLLGRELRNVIEPLCAVDVWPLVDHAQTILVIRVDRVNLALAAVGVLPASIEVEILLENLGEIRPALQDLVERRDAGGEGALAPGDTLGEAEEHERVATIGMERDGLARLEIANRVILAEFLSDVLHVVDEVAGLVLLLAPAEVDPDAPESQLGGPRRAGGSKI